MEVESLSKYIELGYSLEQISKETCFSKTNIRYWIAKYDLKLKRGARGKKAKDFIFPRKCKCGITDPKLFYGNKTTVCKECHQKDTLKRGRDARVFILEKLGNKCRNCNFDKWKSSLDVHHLNPKVKDTSFTTIRYWSKDRIEEEIKQCVLLCKNCHAAFHNGDLENKELSI